VVPTLVTYDSLARHGKEVGAPAHLLDKLWEVTGKGLSISHYWNVPWRAS
jgi:hypothetical protein